MAGRERVTTPAAAGAQADRGLPIAHLALGLAVLILVGLLRPIEGGALGIYSIADRIAQGLIPYRDFSIEYPPIALLHIYLPRLLGGTSLFAYELLFSLISIGLALGTAATVYWLARRGWSSHSPRNTLVLFASLAFAAAPIVLWRFDILPTFLTTLGLAAFAVRRDAWTGVALGLGTAAKLYPAFLGPVFFFVRIMERRFRSAAAQFAAAALVVGAIAVQLYLLAGLDAFSYVLYQDERGVEIESVAGGIALLADVLGIVGAHLFVGFGSWQVTSQVLGQIALPLRVFDVFIVGTLVVTAFWRFRLDVRATGAVRPMTVVTYVVAVLLAVILTNKVLSPQYLVWLLPFVALMARNKALLLIITLALTTLIYPLAFQSLIRVQPAAVIALNVRNLLLLVLYVWIIWPPGATLWLRQQLRARRAG